MIVGLSISFISLIYYRVITVLMFSNPMSLTAAVLAGVSTGTILLFAGNAYFLKSARLASKSGDSKLNSFSFLRVMFPVFVVATLANVFVVYVITIGFSERLFREVSRLYRWGGVLEQNYFWFIIVLLIPVLGHYFLAAGLNKRFFEAAKME